MLILPSALRDKLLAEARAAWPAECCGLLVGTREKGEVNIVAVYPAPNLAPAPADGFEIDPAAHFALQRTLRGTGRAVVGCYHSHPRGAAVPSVRDRACGCEDGFVWIIVASGISETLLAFEGADFRSVGIRG